MRRRIPRTSPAAPALIATFLTSLALALLVYALASAQGDDALEPPTLRRPADGVSTTDTTPTFSWSPASGAVSYAFELATDSDFVTVVIRNEANRRSFSPEVPLTGGETYYWRVAAISASGSEAWSKTRSVTIATAAQPTSTSAPTATKTATRSRKPRPTRTPLPASTATAVPTAGTGSSLSGVLPPSEGLPVTGAGRSNGSRTSTTVVDRDLGTIWVSPSTRPSAAFVYVKLDRTQQIGKIRWLFGVTGRADAMTIEISTDRTNWTPVGRFGNAPAGSWQELTLSASARYVRFFFENPNGDRYLGGLAEIEVWPAETTPTPTATVTFTATSSATPPPTSTPTASPSSTPTATLTPANTSTATAFPSSGATPSPTLTPASTATSAATPSPTQDVSSTATPVPPVADGLVRNPSFEDGRTNWYIEGEARVVNEGAHGGAGVMRLERAGGFTNQHLSLLPGNTYELRVWGRLEGEIDLGYAGVTFQDASGNRLPELEPPMLEFIQPGWVEKTLTFTIPQAVAYVSVLAWKNDGPAAFLVDDFYLIQRVGPEAAPGVPPTVSCQRLLAPAYFYPPTGLWDPLIDGGTGLEIVVLNPNSGVDTKHEWRYDAPLAKARAAGLRIAGYIQTDYGDRPAAAVIDEMERYREWYGVTSFFIDEADTEPESIPLYRELTDYVHAMGGIAILNFGYRPHPGFMEIADILVVFEGSASIYAAYELPAWIDEYPAHRFAQLIYGVSTENLNRVLTRARESNVGYVWITDDHITTGSPYNTLPSYWTELNAEVTAGC